MGLLQLLQIRVQTPDIAFSIPVEKVQVEMIHILDMSCSL